MIKIHALQTGKVRVKQVQLTGASNNLSRIWEVFFTQNWSHWFPIYCWLIEHPDGLFLVDVGEIAKVQQPGYLPDNPIFRAVMQCEVSQEDEIDQQLAQRGFTTNDITAIFLTHLHTDHIGGIGHFPDTPVYVPKADYNVAIGPRGEGSGFLKKNWPHWFNPELIEFDDPAEGVFLVSKKMTEDGSIVAIPTPGHSIGHTSYVVYSEDTRYVLSGDVTYNIATLLDSIPNIVLNNAAANDSVAKLRRYALAIPTVVLTSHDPDVPRILEQKHIVVGR
ncbi:MAG: N-acyl homoserine lactonase family protein [Chloroflexota bacterium]